MLIPQFSLRWLLGLMAVCAGASLILGFAIRQQPWAIGMTAALGSVALLAVLYVITFLAAWLLARMAEKTFGRTPTGQSPFAKEPEGMLIEPAAVAPEVATSENPSPISG